MAIKLFVAVCLVVSIFSLLIQTQSEQKIIDKKDLPLVTFENATMFTFNNEYVTQLVKTAVASRYESRDELEIATLILRQKNNGNDQMDIIISDLITKKEDMIYFNKNVKFNRDGEFLIETQELVYDSLKKVAYNDTNFNGIYQDNYFSGENLYFEQSTKNIQANDIYFKINLNKIEGN